MTFQEKHHETILFVRLYKFGGLALDIMLERILSLIPKKENGDFQHGAKKEFAQSIGFKNGNIVSLWISGASKSYKGKLAEISDKYNVSMDWLCGKENAKEPIEIDRKENEIQGQAVGNQTFFEVYQSLCLSIGKKPGAVARELGISSPSVTQWKRGPVPRPAVLKKIADYFNVSITYLLGENDQKENPPTESQRIIENINSSENVDLLLHIIKNEASLSREQLLKLQGFVSALEAENK